MKHERKKTIDECWEFWSKYFLNKDGSINIENLKKELYDLDFCHDQISRVYCTITGNKLFYSSYYADTIIGVYEQEIQDAYDEGAADLEKVEKQRNQLLEVSKEIYEHWTRLKKAAPSVPNTMYDKLEQTIQSVEGEDEI